MILIVDDRQENIFSLKTVLDQHGFSTDSALSGEEALKKVLQNEYALILLDVQMPGMDGFEVAEAISSLNKTKDIPIIFLSAVNRHKKFITKGFESGAVEYLTKPVDPDILILKVRNFYRLYEKTHALKETERALKETVNELHSTLESLPQIAFTADKDGRIEFVNKQWYLYASSKEEFPQTAPGEKPLKNDWLEQIASGEAVEKEVYIKLEDSDTYQYHLLRATPIIVNGSLTKWVGTFTNIHEQKLLNEELERRVAERTHELLEINRELEITNNDLHQFTFVASHDLKEPLRKIHFYGHLIKEKAVTDATTQKYLDKILRSSGRMSNLISDLLSFARLSQSEIFELTDINSIVNEIIQDLELIIQEKNAVIQIEELPQIQVVPSLMRQLFQNLIGNALKFTKPGVAPLIKITSEYINQPYIDSPATDDGLYCRICISDNGIGFDEKYSDKIFTLFQRLNAREEYEGTGIGLAIAKKIVDKHNGIITPKSKPGEGTTFLIILPVQQENTDTSTYSPLINSQHT
ncbi:MAG TPA: response regulator [Flavisolibacter sp.]|nr:response regulator [Flavisolibacter sp.]